MINSMKFFLACFVAGFALLIYYWVISGNISIFFLALFMVCTTLLRLRFPRLKYTLAIDFIACIAIQPIAVIIPLLSAMYYSLEKERQSWITAHDNKTGQLYELEQLQNDLTAATAQVERMTVISERARIAREIHDNAGHQIVAAYMSLQTARDLFSNTDGSNTVALELYDTALERLQQGTHQIRDAVHNLAPVTTLGVQSLIEICEKYPQSVNFKSFGDTSHIPVHVWGVMEVCLKEALTNCARHAKPNIIDVNLDTTPHLIRLCVENDGIFTTTTPTPGGNGLRNLRHRTASIGGTLSTDAVGDIFRVICVVKL